MKKIISLLLSLSFVCLIGAAVQAQTKNALKSGGKNPGERLRFETSAELQTLLSTAAGETVAEFASKNMKPEYLAATLIDMRDPNNLKTAHVRGDEKIYPASVVKMFYMV